MPVVFDADDVVEYALIGSHDAADGSGQPVQHNLPCAAMCAAMGHSIAGPLPAVAMTVIVVPQSIAASIPTIDWVPPPIAVNDSHAPRGPPFA